MEPMHPQPLVIIGSSRRKSNTLALVEKTMAGTNYRLADLLDYSIAPYNYEHHYPEEDSFIQLINLVLQHQTIVLATPVYWYSMSGSMKLFFDRLTDLLKVQKPLGRQLKGKSIFVLASGNNLALPEGFLVPFELSCQYLGMNFGGSLYESEESSPSGAGSEKETAEFRRKLFECLSAASWNFPAAPCQNQRQS